MSDNPITPQGWQPIETAPKDGTPVLLWPTGMVGWWEFGDNQWMVGSVPLNDDLTVAYDWSKATKFFCLYAADGYFPEPTHWHALPPAPGESA